MSHPQIERRAELRPSWCLSIRLTAITADEFGATVADPFSAVDPPDARYTTSTDMTERQLTGLLP
jgi:hypothetical protein